MTDLISKRTKVIERVAEQANKASPSTYIASDAQFAAWGSKEHPPKGVTRLEDVEHVQERDGRQYILALREVDGAWLPTKYEILSVN